MEKTNNNFFEFTAVLACGLLLFTLGIYDNEFISFETRFALFAKEMLQDGPSFFPTIHHQPYPDYPAASTFLIYAFTKFWGEFNKFSAVFPSAVAAAITLATTYLIGALRDKRWGWYAVFFLLMTETFFIEARTISLDQYVTAVTCVCFYLVYSAAVLQKPSRLYFVPILLIIGFVFRGPIGLIIPSSILVIFYLLEKDFKKVFIFGFLAFFLLLLCSGVLLWLAHKTGGIHLSNAVLNWQIFSRMHASGNIPPHYYYFVSGFGAYAIPFPLAILIFLGLRKELRHNFFHPREGEDPASLQLLQKLIVWALIILIGMTIPGDKKLRYVLAISPALALISAYLFVMAREKKYFRNLYQTVISLFYFFPLLGIILTAVAIVIIRHKHLSVDTSHYLGILVLFSGLMIANFLVSKLQRNIALLQVELLLTTCVTFIVCHLYLFEPINLSFNHTRDVVERLETLRHHAHAHLIFYREDPDGFALKYLVNTKIDEQPTFINEPQDLQKSKPNSFFVTDEKEFKQLPKNISEHLNIIAEDEMARKHVIVFSR